MKSYNQAGQEEWVRSTLDNKLNGFFVDIGAYDGVESSNTFFLEHELNWSGLCIESNPNYFSRLVQTRKCKLDNIAVMGYKGYCIFDGISTYYTQNNSGHNLVQCDTLDSILIKNQCPKEIDYVSMDIEGNELNVLKNFKFSDWDIKLFTIEHNLYLVGDIYKSKIKEIMIANGYKLAVENVLCPTGPYEDWYAKIK